MWRKEELEMKNGFALELQANGNKTDFEQLLQLNAIFNSEAFDELWR